MNKNDKFSKFSKVSGIYNIYLKRFLDFFISLLALIILLPLFILIFLIVKVNLGSPVIFKQERPGLNEKKFTLYKFRTMNDKRGVDGELLPDYERITKLGKLLRSTSLDEIPELFNILKGDMSFIGPRPLAVQYLPYYNDKERIRHSVKPGLTGLAQVNGRGIASWESRFAFDVEYINNLSILMDIKIIVITIGKVFKRSDVGERGIDSPPDFDKYRQNQFNVNDGSLKDLK